MSAIVYPAELPCPVTAPIQSKERRILSSLPGPRQSRPAQRDRLATQELSFVFATFELVEIFEAWFENDLIKGGSWFASDWPLPQGGTGVRRFVGAPVWSEFLPKVGWRMQATVEVRGRGELPQTSILSLHPELLMHFDEFSPIGWKDSSFNDWTVALVPNGGTFASNEGGAFGRCANIQQLAPGRGEPIYYDEHAWINVQGNHNLGNKDFFITFWADFQGLAPLATWSYTIIDNVPDTLSAGYYLYFQTQPDGLTLDGKLSVVTLVSGMPATTEMILPNVPLSGLHHYAFSRKNTLFSCYLDGELIAGNNSFDPGEEVLPQTRGFMRLFAYNTNLTPPPVELIFSFQGLFEELAIFIGPGSGVDASFPIPTVPYSP